MSQEFKRSPRLQKGYDTCFIRAQQSLSNDVRAVHSSGYAHISRSSHVFSQYSLKRAEANMLQ